MKEIQKIILDTDIGDDIDDALALALALEEPELELIGVTTVFQNTDKRARIAKKMLSLWGSQVPVYAGISLGEGTVMSYWDQPCQYTSDLDAPEYAPGNDFRQDGGQAAVDFILESARKYGKDLTLVAVGPLSNVAAAIRQDPQTMRGIRRVVLMGGCFHRQFAEWNILCDAPAAKTVLEFDLEAVCIGLDVTEKTMLSRQQHEMLLAADKDEKRKYVASLVKLWSDYTGKIPYLHDPLTVFYVAHPEYVLVEPTWIAVETKGEYTVGVTLDMDAVYSYLPFDESKHRQGVARCLQRQGFMDRCLAVILGTNQ